MRLTLDSWLAHDHPVHADHGRWATVRQNILTVTDSVHVVGYGTVGTQVNLSGMLTPAAGCLRVLCFRWFLQLLSKRSVYAHRAKVWAEMGVALTELVVMIVEIIHSYFQESASSWLPKATSLGLHVRLLRPHLLILTRTSVDIGMLSAIIVASTRAFQPSLDRGQKTVLVVAVFVLLHLFFRQLRAMYTRSAKLVANHK